MYNDRVYRSFMQSNKLFAVVLFLIIASFGGGVLSGTLAEGIRGDVQVNYSERLDAEFMNEVLSQLDETYLGDGIGDSKALTHGAIKGMVASLDDKHTSYLDPAEAEEYFQSANSEFEGIGITLSSEDGITEIETVLDGQPAQSAGLNSGDLIVEVDGVDTTELQAAEVATLIRGEAGTTVKIEVFRPSISERVVFDIVRSRIDLPNIEWELIDDVAVIKIYRFTEDSLQSFVNNWDRTVAEVRQQNPRGVVVDVRNNPGGFVDGVVYVAEEFLPNGQVVLQEETKGGRRLESIDQRTGSFEGLPLVVLVNEGSASASEILAGAVQDNNRGQVVGVSTVGKGVEQRLITLSDESLLIVVFRKWLTPAGRNIDSDHPILPDVIIESIPAVGEDEQLVKALELINNRN